jgi:hypothetical protein
MIPHTSSLVSPSSRANETHERRGPSDLADVRKDLATFDNLVQNADLLRNQIEQILHGARQVAEEAQRGFRKAFATYGRLFERLERRTEGPQVIV